MVSAALVPQKIEVTVNLWIENEDNDVPRGEDVQRESHDNSESNSKEGQNDEGIRGLHKVEENVALDVVLVGPAACHTHAEIDRGSDRNGAAIDPLHI